MKVSSSILSSKNLPEDLKKIDLTDADYIHLDIMDGKFVSNKTMPFRYMKNIYKFTSKRLDVHLMVENPSKYIPYYAELNTEYITFHIETLESIEKNLELIRSYSIKCGLALKPETKVSLLVPYLPYLDLILIMSVEPGRGGQNFISGSEDKIKEVRELLNEYHASAMISVDGGINQNTVSLCKDSDMVVSGNYIISSSDFQEKITSLR